MNSGIDTDNATGNLAGACLIRDFGKPDPLAAAGALTILVRRFFQGLPEIQPSHIQSHPRLRV